MSDIKHFSFLTERAVVTMKQRHVPAELWLLEMIAVVLDVWDPNLSNVTKVWRAKCVMSVIRYDPGV